MINIVRIPVTLAPGRAIRSRSAVEGVWRDANGNPVPDGLPATSRSCSIRSRAPSTAGGPPSFMTMGWPPGTRDHRQRLVPRVLPRPAGVLTLVGVVRARTPPPRRRRAHRVPSPRLGAVGGAERLGRRGLRGQRGIRRRAPSSNAGLGPSIPSAATEANAACATPQTRLPGERVTSGLRYPGERTRAPQPARPPPLSPASLGLGAGPEGPAGPGTEPEPERTGRPGAGRPRASDPRRRRRRPTRDLGRPHPVAAHADRALRPVAQPPEGVQVLAGAALAEPDLVRRHVRGRGRELRVHLAAAAAGPAHRPVVRGRHVAARRATRSAASCPGGAAAGGAISYRLLVTRRHPRRPPSAPGSRPPPSSAPRRSSRSRCSPSLPCWPGGPVPSGLAQSAWLGAGVFALALGVGAVFIRTDRAAAGRRTRGPGRPEPAAAQGRAAQRPA